MINPQFVQQLKSDNKQPAHISFEFFPPKSEEMLKMLFESAAKFAKFNPNFMTVTYGAGGSTKKHTAEIASQIQTTTSIPVAAHLTAVNATKKDIDEVLEDYALKNIQHIVALRGDMPGLKGKYIPHPEGYAYAVDLVKSIKRRNQFKISVAAYPEIHPEALSEQADMDNLKRKVDAGADNIITQYSFDNDRIISYIDKVRNAGINIPVIIGVMLFHNFNQLCNFSQRCGAEIPSWLINLCKNIDNDIVSRDFISAYIAAEQCRILMSHNIDKFHFYCLNRSDTAISLLKLLNVKES